VVPGFHPQDGIASHRKAAAVDRLLNNLEPDEGLNRTGDLRQLAEEGGMHGLP
jgi:hypothetical protein